MFQFTERVKGATRIGLGILAAALSAHADATYTVGPRVTVLGDKAGGLTQFPETPITILQKSPEYQVLIATGLNTAYCHGTSMSTLTASSFALRPSGTSYDEVSAHISSVWHDPGTSDIYGVFNANDSEQVPRIPGPGIGFRGRYFTTALAKSTDGGKTFTKIGPILSIPKNMTADDLQGDAYGSVVMDPTGTYLYTYYGDMYNAVRRGGVQTCVARATVASHGLPGSWKKWYNGDWVTPGISVIDTNTGNGAETTPVVTNTVSLYGDAMYPHVSYSKKLGMYVMVYAVNVFDEIPEPDSAGNFPPADLSGIYIAYSKDAVNWGGNTQLLKTIVIDYPGREVALHASLDIDDDNSSPTNLKATLYYGYNKDMWLGTPATQYLVSNSVDVAFPEGFWDVLAVKAPVAQNKSRGLDYMVRQGAAGQLFVDFLKGDVFSLRVVGADGSAAGKTSKVGEGRYQLEVSRSAGPLFLQGYSGGKSFSHMLRMP